MIICVSKSPGSPLQLAELSEFWKSALVLVWYIWSQSQAECWRNEVSLFSKVYVGSVSCGAISVGKSTRNFTAWLTRRIALSSVVTVGEQCQKRLMYSVLRLCDYFMWLQDSVLYLQPMQIQIQCNLNDKGWFGLFNTWEIGINHLVFGSFPSGEREEWLVLPGVLAEERWISRFCLTIFY